MASCADGVKHYCYYNCLCYSVTSVQGGRKTEFMEYGSSSSRLVVGMCVYGCVHVYRNCVRLHHRLHVMVRCQKGIVTDVESRTGRVE